MTAEAEHTPFTSIDQLACPSWCRSDHAADLANSSGTDILCDVMHLGVRLEPVPFGHPKARTVLAAAELEAMTDDDGQPRAPEVYFMPAGVTDGGWPLTLPELRQQAATMREHADRLDAYAASVQKLIDGRGHVVGERKP